MREGRYVWPIKLLFALSVAVVQGARLEHGDVLDAGDPALAGFDYPASIHQWVVARNQCIEAERRADQGIAQTLLLIPVLTKKRVQAGSAGLTVANKLEQRNWKALALPLSASGPGSNRP